MGLGVVVFLFTFIPGYQATIQARQVKVAWLYARLGTKPASFGIIEWFLLSGKFDDLSDVWEEWEEWFRNLIETHALAPVLAFVPTVHSGQTWLVPRPLSSTRPRSAYPPLMPRACLRRDCATRRAWRRCAHSGGTCRPSDSRCRCRSAGALLLRPDRLSMLPAIGWRRSVHR